MFIYGSINARKFISFKTGNGSTGYGSATLNQVTPNSPTAQPNMVPPTVQPQGSPMPNFSNASPEVMNQATTQPQPQAGLPAGDPEASLILKSLSKRLETLGKLGR